MSHQRFASRARKPLGQQDRNPRKRKPWTFEKLEDRMVFSVDLSNMHAASWSSDNAVGAALTAANEAHWAQLTYGTASGSMTDGTPKLSRMSLPNDPYFPDPT